MSFAAVAGAGIGLIGTYLTSQNASDAANTAAQDQQNAANQSNALLKQMYQQSYGDLAPYRQEGTNALGAMNQLYGFGTGPNGTQGTPDYSGFENSPNYQFALQQGTNALDASAAAKGRLYSGGYGEDLTKFAQGLAGQQLNAYQQQLAQMAGMGQQAAGFGSNLAMNYAQGSGMNNMMAGTAAANGAIGSANAINGGINQLGQYLGYGLQSSGLFSGGGGIPQVAPETFAPQQLSGINDIQTPMAPIQAWTGQ